MLGGRYRLVTPVGVGTSSRVHLAVDTQLRRRVAVKLLHEALAEDDAFLRRFRAEARAAGALNHPNILAVFDWGEDRHDGALVPYLVTEYLGGGSLRDVLDTGARLTPSQTLVVGLEAARALSHAHQRGLVHRDVKPGNLLFDEDGRLRLADFGLARALAEASWTEPTGSAVGTARYASPEQALGRRLDGRSDVYSLALVLVECVTGRVPFAGDSTASTLALRTQGDLEPGPELAGLRSVLTRAGRLDPDDRPEAAELEIALMAAAEGLDRPEPLPLVPTLAEERTSELRPDGLGGLAVIDLADPHGSDLVPGRADTPADEVATPGTATPADGGAVGAAEGAPADPASARTPITVAEEHELLWASRPADLGPVEPLGEPSEPTGRGRRRPRRVLLVVALLVALLGGAGAAWWTWVRVPVHDVPDLVGLDVEEARSVAAENGWTVDDESVDRRDGTEPGEVLDQEPPAGEGLAEGEELRLVVSLGPTLTDLPELAGRPEAEAVAALDAAGLVVEGPTRAHDEEVPQGAVVSSEVADPAVSVDEQGRVPRGTPVALVVSDGPAPRVVPEGLQGARVEDAEAALERIQLVPLRNPQPNETVPEGFVVSVSEEPGAELPRGAEVTLEVSTGPPPVPVPDVSGVTGSAAAAQLEAEGFVVAGIEGSPSGTVLATDPPAGEPHRRGTAVRIFTRS